MNAFITGIGWVTPTNMGCGKAHDRFEMTPGRLPEIERKDVFDEPYPHFGRLDRYSRVGLSAIAFALKDAGLERGPRKRPIGIVASTVHGCLQTDVDYFDTVIPHAGRLASPNLFAYTLPNSYIGEAAIRFGLTGTTFVISESSDSELWFLRLALIGMSEGQSEIMLAGWCDLGHRGPYSEFEHTAGGALYFVIEKNARHRSEYYGRLGLDHHGELTFNGAQVKDMQALTQNCIAAH